MPASDQGSSFPWSGSELAPHPALSSRQHYPLGSQVADKVAPGLPAPCPTHSQGTQLLPCQAKATCPGDQRALPASRPLSSEVSLTRAALRLLRDPHSTLTVNQGQGGHHQSLFSPLQQSLVTVFIDYEVHTVG
jgi:hypothetical protein